MRKPSPSPFSVRPEPVEGLFFLSARMKKERCFDKLSTNGVRDTLRFLAGSTKGAPCC